MGQFYCSEEDCEQRAVHFVATGTFCLDCYKEHVPMDFSSDDKSPSERQQ